MVAVAKRYSVIFTVERVVRTPEDSEEILKELEDLALPLGEEEKKEFYGDDWEEIEYECEEYDENIHICKVKINAVLDPVDFEKFINEYDLEFEAETTGAIGSRAFPFAHVPALSFTSWDDQDSYNAYVTPYSETSSGEIDITEKMLEELKEME